MLSYNNPRVPFSNSHQNAAAMDVTAPAQDRLMGSLARDVGKQDHAKPDHPHRHIWLITGPAGCGKTTVAEYIAKALKLPFIEGDNFHTKSNVDKMSHGTPLTDQDRWDWLIVLRDAAMQRLDGGGSSGVVVTCSALKKRYRDVIRIAHYTSPDVLVRFIFLHAPEHLLLQRVRARKGHYMGPNMVHSQLETLERPSPDETDVLTIDVSGVVTDVENTALTMVQDKTEADAHLVFF